MKQMKYTMERCVETSHVQSNCSRNSLSVIGHVISELTAFLFYLYIFFLESISRPVLLWLFYLIQRYQKIYLKIICNDLGQKYFYILNFKTKLAYSEKYRPQQVIF